MKHIKEPYIQIMASEAVELIQLWEWKNRNYKTGEPTKFAAYLERASKKIRKFNRQTLVN